MGAGCVQGTSGFRSPDTLPNLRGKALTAAFVLTLVVLAVIASVAAAVLGDPQVASLSDAGQAGTQDARGAAVSGDGRYVAFTSTGALAGVPTGGVLQLYVRDRVAGRTLIASASAAGEPADAPVDDPAAHRAFAISGDGRYAVFASPASNLVDDDPDGTNRDVFRKDLVTGALAVVSRAPGGAQANGSVAGDPDVSYDGSRVVLGTGSAENLWAGDTSSASDIVMRDLTFDTSAIVSVTAAGQPAAQVAGAAISADGRHVAFEAGSASLVRDLVTQSTITAAVSGAAPDLSGDGGIVVFEAGGGVSRRELPGGPTTLVAASASSPAVSADGARVAYETASAIFARRLTATAERVSARADGSFVTQPSIRPAISGNGGVVAFTHDDAGVSPPLAVGDLDSSSDALVARLAPSDAAGPQFTIVPSVDGAPLAGAATATVRGAVGDPSGIVGVTVGGFPAAVSPSGSFTVEVPLAVGLNAVAIRAVDGAGNVTEMTLAHERTVPTEPRPAVRARARALRVAKVGRRTLVRFRLDPGAKRVTARLWRRVPRAGAPPSWTPAGPLRIVATTPGARAALLSRTPLRPEIYQVRVGVVSTGGVAVTVLRYRVLRARIR